MDNRLFVITRRDLAPGLAATQAIHAAVQLVARCGLPFAHDIPWVITYAVADEPSLKVWEQRLRDKGGQMWTGFREPDIDNQLTALAYYGKKVSGMGGLRLL